MFVFILITAELAILYTVFWYLYLRQPKQSRRIVGSTWGSYHPAATANGIDQSTYAYDAGSAFSHNYMEAAQSTQSCAVKPFMLPVYEEMVLDLRSNRYVPLPRKRTTVLAALIRQLDDCLSELNVKP